MSIKLPIYVVFIRPRAVRNDFDLGDSHYLGHWLRSGDSRAQNRRDFQHNNSNPPSYVNLPPQNHYARGRINTT